MRQHPRSPRREIASTVGPAFGVGLVVLLAFVGLLDGALHSPRPHDVPVAVVAPASALRQLADGLSAKAPGAFELRSYRSPAAARAALADHEVDGALILAAPRPQLLVAGAAGPAPTEAITAALTAATRSDGQPLDIHDVRPLPAADARNLGAFFAVVGLTISAVLFTVLMYVRARSVAPRPRLTALGAFTAMAALTVALVSNVLVGAPGGSFWALAGLGMLASLAVASTIAGLARLLGLPGIAVGALIVFILGVSASGGPADYHFLPGFWRAVSQYLPPGAAMTAIRNALYFDGGVTGPVLILAGWTVVGLALTAAADALPARRPATHAGAAHPASGPITR